MKAFPIAAATTALLMAAGLSASVAAQEYGDPRPVPSYGAQTNGDEDIVVMGRHRIPSDAETASQRVSYRDLDLRKEWARDELRHRVRLTARFLCDKLGDNAAMDGTRSCEDDATRDAMKRVGTIEANWAPRSTAWVPGPAWRAPYSDEWAAAHDGGYTGGY